MPAKTTKKTTVKKIATKPVPVMEHRCECGEHCNCHCHGSAHWIKHIIVWAIIFALGMVAGKIMYSGAPQCMQHKKMHPVFTNGCLDMQSIDCPKMREALANADVNNDECISLEEYKAIKKTMKPEHKRVRRKAEKQY